MTNAILWFILLIVNFLLIMLCYKLFGKAGLFSWIAISTILANIQVLKTVELFGIVMTLGNIVHATSFLATDILSEQYSKEDANKGVNIGVFSLLASTLVMNICLYFVPHETDIADAALKQIFSIMPRIALSSVISYALTQKLDVWLFHKIKDKYPKQLWLRNNVATITSQLVDAVLFNLMAFAGVLPWNIIWQIFISTFILKAVVALFDTPVIYWAVKITPADNEERLILQAHRKTADSD
ncbi:MAG: queuosine precursor transporter [Candidatus Riflebacteria bacterium]|mgnify:CR=1 FL=1|nr:queuosine precursor transporter [Candidatus Riflebacteria bacterium]